MFMKWFPVFSSFYARGTWLILRLRVTSRDRCGLAQFASRSGCTRDVLVSLLSCSIVWSPALFNILLENSLPPIVEPFVILKFFQTLDISYVSIVDIVRTLTAFISLTELHTCVGHEAYYLCINYTWSFILHFGDTGPTVTHVRMRVCGCGCVFMVWDISNMYQRGVLVYLTKLVQVCRLCLVER